MPWAFWADRRRRQQAADEALPAAAAHQVALRSALPAALAHVPDTEVPAAVAACRLTARGYPPYRVCELTGIDPELAQLIARLADVE